MPVSTWHCFKLFSSQMRAQAGGSSIWKSPWTCCFSTLGEIANICQHECYWKAGNRIKAKFLKFCRVTIVQISFDLPTLAMKRLTGHSCVSYFCISPHRCLAIPALKSCGTGSQKKLSRAMAQQESCPGRGTDHAQI